MLVMYAGKAVERGTADQTSSTRPSTPTPGACCTSMPRLDRSAPERLGPIPGNPPSLINLPSGCAFHPRCAFTADVPGDRLPHRASPSSTGRDRHPVRCHIAGERAQTIFETEIRPTLQPEEHA